MLEKTATSRKNSDYQVSPEKAKLAKVRIVDKLSLVEETRMLEKRAEKSKARNLEGIKVLEGSTVKNKIGPFAMGG